MIALHDLCLVLVRHAEPGATLKGTFLGRTDPGLGAVGQDQATLLADFLAGERHRLKGPEPALVAHSDLRRAVETARPIATALGMPLRADIRLREIDFGAWDGRTQQSVSAEDLERMSAWFQDPVDTAPPDGEDLRTVDERVGAWLDDLRGEGIGGAVVVGHFGSLAVLAARLLELPIESAVRLRLGRGQCACISGGALRWWGLPLAD